MLDRSYISSQATELFCKLEFPDEAVKVLTESLDTLTSPEYFDQFKKILSEYERSENCPYSEMIENMKKLSESAGIHEYTGALLLLVCMAPKLKERYAQKGISEEIFYDTISDLRYKLYECLEVHGIVGNFVAYWYAGFFNLTRFGFGKLQFEPKKLGVDCEYNGVYLSADTDVLNTHIPRTGKRLDRNDVLESYRKGRDFFRKYFPHIFTDEKVIFCCSSWLLDPWNLTVLSEGSNLRAFITDYHIIEQGEYENYKDLWRLFDKMYTGDPDALPQNTSLRRAYAERVRRGEKTGWAKGIFILDR